MASATVGTLRTVLEADVSQFNASFASASKTTKQWAKDFEVIGKSAKDTGAAFTQSLERSLSNTIRLAKEFSGAGIAKTADEMAAAVTRIGGPLRLTATEQARVNATITEAIAKYKALGQEAPAHLQKLADATRQTSATFGPLTESFSRLAAGFTIGNLITKGISGLSDFGRQAFETASQIHDLALKTGTSAEFVQRMGYAASQSGSSMDAVTTAISKMNAVLGEGGKGTIDLLKRLGLDLTTLKAGGPEEAFKAITDAIQNSTDASLRALATQKLLGKGGQELLAAIMEGITGLGNQTTVMSNTTVNRLEAAQDAWTKFGHGITIVTGEALGSIFSFTDEAFGSLGKLQKFLEDFGRGGIGGAVAGAVSRGAAFDAASTTLSAGERKFIDEARSGSKPWVNKDLAEWLHKTVETINAYKSVASSATKVSTDFAAALKAAQAEVRGLTAEDRKQIDAAEKLHVSEDKIAESVGVSEEAIKLYTEQMEKIRVETEKAKAAQERYDDEVARFYARLRNSDQTMSKFIGNLRDITKEAKAQFSVETFNDFKLPTISTDSGKFLKGLTGLDPKLLAKDFGDSISLEIGKTFQQLPTTIARSLEGGGGLAGGVESIFMQLGQNVGTAVGKNVGAAIGATVGSVVGGVVTAGIGIAVGAAISAVAATSAQKHQLEDAIRAIGGTPDPHYGVGTPGYSNKEIKQNLTNQLAALKAAADAIKKAKDDIAAQAKADADRELSNLEALGFPNREELQKTADSLKHTYDDALKSGKYSTEQLAVAWKHVAEATNAALGIVAPDFKSLIALGDQYGLTLKDMGKGVQFGTISDQVSQLVADYKTLTGAGADHVFSNFEARFQDIFLQAKKFGTEVPESIRPYLQQMVNLGDLVDETGKKMTDLSGIEFKADQADATRDAIDATHAWTEATADATAAMRNLATAFTAGRSYSSIPLADVPLMSVTAPGVVRVTPGDVIGKPGMTPGFSGFNMDRPIAITLPVYVGGKMVDNYIVETTLRKLEQNDSGGANVSYRTRIQKVVG